MLQPLWDASALAKRYAPENGSDTADALFAHTAQSFAGSPCALVASDQRLLRAAEAEGLATLNPELLPAAEVPTQLASL